MPSASQAAEAHGKIPVDIQARLVELFSEDNCAGVRNLVRPKDISSLKPNVMAIVAYCEPPGVDSEAVFLDAETLDPTGDLILTLHAKYTWKKNPEAAESLWQKVLMFARNPYLKSMAQEYLSGMVTVDKPLSLGRTTFFGSFLLGASNESNAKFPDLAFAPSAASPTMNFQTRLKAQHWFPSGSISSNYSLDLSQHFSVSRYNLIIQELDLPYALHAGKNEDIVFRPLVGLTTLGGSAFQSKYGIGVLGIIYRPEYKQSIQGLIYTDQIYIPELAGEEAAHYHFDYTWEFFPKYWLITTQFSIEHAAAPNSLSYNGIRGVFNNAHTDSSLQFNFQREFRLFSVGLLPKILWRADSGQSQYASRLGGPQIVKTRVDTDLSFQPNITIPIAPYVHLYAWYEWHQVSSNVGAEDYVDRNFLDQIVGVALKTYLSSY